MSMLCVKPKEEEGSSSSTIQQTPYDDRDLNLKSLIARKKLHLVLDLDHTLFHAIKTKELTAKDQGCLNHWSRRNWLKEGKLFKFKDDYLVKPRPNVYAFLKEASSMFDLSIYTLETREFAFEALNILDPKGLYISSANVFSAEDCTKPRIKSLDVVNQDERVVLVVDDTKWVWADNPKNVVEIQPYVFFDEKGFKVNMKHAGLQLGGDESEKYGELARVLRELKKIYIAFFDSESNQVDYENRDVRDVVEDVRKNFRLLK